jgi:hypothetical protein
VDEFIDIDMYREMFLIWRPSNRGKNLTERRGNKRWES